MPQRLFAYTTGRFAAEAVSPLPRRGAGGEGNVKQPGRFLLLLFLLLTTGLTAQQSTNEQVLARAELGRKTIELGDQIWLTVNISAPPGTEVSGLAPDFIDALDGLETIDAKELNVIAEAPERLLQQRFLITSFDTGYIAVPPLPFVFKAADGRLDTAYTNDLLLTVNALPVGDDEEIMPIKPIIEEPLNLLDFWWLFLLMIVGGLAYILYVIQKRRQADAPPPPPPPPAYIIALDALKELEGKELWQQSQTKEYYSELTHILREYLEGRFDVQALEMTTRQINDKLVKRNDFDQGRAKELSKLLQLSDLVKFAKARPAVELHAEGLERVRAFVKETGVETEPEPVPEPNTVAVVAPPASPAPAAEPPESSSQAVTAGGSSGAKQSNSYAVEDAGRLDDATDNLTTDISNPTADSGQRTIDNRPQTTENQQPTTEEE